MQYGARERAKRRAARAAQAAAQGMAGQTMAFVSGLRDAAMIDSEKPEWVN
jgi:hypothetical protein